MKFQKIQHALRIEFDICCTFLRNLSILKQSKTCRLYEDTFQQDRWTFVVLVFSIIYTFLTSWLSIIVKLYVFVAQRI